MIAKTLIAFFLIILGVGFIFSSLFPSCNEGYRNKSHAGIADESIVKGRKLAEKHCQSCHMFPEPSTLDSKSWEEGVMPQMAPRLGIFEYLFQQYPSEAYNRNLEKDYYPSKPQISMEEWQDLMNYYIATSPDTLPAQKRKQKLRTTLPFFKVQIPSLRYSKPATGLVKIAGHVNSKSLFVSDVVRKVLYRYDKNFGVIDSVKSSGSIVDIEVNTNTIISCNIGELNPHIGKFGDGGRLNANLSAKIHKDFRPFIKDLERPVQISSADFNNDYREDYLVCEFGYLTGSLSWFENQGNDSYEKHVLRPMPGALKAYIQDYNKDGLLDIWVMFSQGEEGIFLFTNKGNGKFSSSQVLRFPSVYGSSYFELCDFNKDGHSDIIYTAGDNADFSPVLKPYHGVYIFINNGENKFEQTYFFPINGCYKALSYDYDQDGDIDIATIAFFPDFKTQPGESFIYLENRGVYNFIPYTFPEAVSGRWLTMDSGDLDNDGKMDLVLGNFSITPNPLKIKINWQKGPPFVVLKNISK